VQRAAVDVHHVVRHVDDVRDRAHLREEEPRSEPLRRRADRDVAEEAADVARAPLEVLDSDIDLLFVDGRRILDLGQPQLSAEERRHLPRETDHREQVDAVDRRSRVEHLVADREDVQERRAGLGPVGQDDDPGVVLAEADLVLGQDHPARRLAAELPLVERDVEDRQVRARERYGDGRSHLEVPGAADDLARVALPHVDLAHAQPIRVRVRSDLEHLPDQEAAEVAVDVGDAHVDHTLDIERGDRQPARNLLRRRVDGDVLAEP
jgi:hypothetical protein